MTGGIVWQNWWRGKELFDWCLCSGWWKCRARIVWIVTRSPSLLRYLTSCYPTSLIYTKETKQQSPYIIISPTNQSRSYYCFIFIIQPLSYLQRFSPSHGTIISIKPPLYTKMIVSTSRLSTCSFSLPHLPILSKTLYFFWVSSHSLALSFNLSIIPK